MADWRDEPTPIRSVEVVPSSGTIYSSDGMWWWNGASWVPSAAPWRAMPAGWRPVAAAAPRGPFASGALGCLGVGFAAAAVLAAALLLMGACGLGTLILGSGAPTP